MASSSTDPNANVKRPTGTSSSPRVRIDELAILVRRTTPDGVRYELKPSRHMTAAEDPVVPVFDGWMQGGELVVRASGLADGPFQVCLDLDGNRAGQMVEANTGQSSSAFLHFSFEVVVPLRALAPFIGTSVRLGVAIAPGDRVLRLVRTTLFPLRAAGPRLLSLDLAEATEALLFDAPERHLFDLQNPEEGIWAGSGQWRLRLFAEWDKDDAEAYTLETRPARLLHRWQRTNDASDVLWEDTTRRAGGRRTYTEFMFDSSHEDIGDIPPEGRDIPLDVIVEHELSFAGNTCSMTWHAPMPLRLRNPIPLLKRFKRLSAVGIDFGTTSTVAALHHKGFRSLLRLGGNSTDESWENPTYLLVEDHQRLWDEMARASGGRRFPNLMRVVLASHAAHAKMAESPNAVVGELKSLPERVVILDQSPQLRDRQQQADFLLDEPRVRMLIRTYAYLLGRAINRPGQDVYLHYWLTHPAKFDKRTRALLEEEIRAGILLSIPEGIPTEEVTVSMRASEPEAFAAEVCPELAAEPALEPIISKFGELRFAVFDFGGGTLDIACGRFRPATELETSESGASTVIETLQVGGDDHLGGDYLTHELVWLTHQHDKHLPEMESKEVPMMRPQTVPPNTLSSKPHLYKRSLAGRQNMIRFQRELGLEAVKFKRANEPKRIEELVAARLDGSEVALTTLKTDLAGLHANLTGHLKDRIRDGARLLSSMLRNTSWGGGGDWKEQGVVLLLAGNSSRSEFVERALAEELEVPDMKVWRPGCKTPFQQVVLYETPSRLERGVKTVGITPKTAVALGALRIANREVHLVRRAQGFSYFLGDLRGFPPKFVALVPMGSLPADANEFGNHFVDMGTWDGQKPFRVCKDYEPGKMTSNDPRLSIVPTNLPIEASGHLFVCVVAPDELVLHLEREDDEPLRTTLNLAKYMD